MVVVVVCKGEERRGVERVDGGNIRRGNISQLTSTTA